MDSGLDAFVEETLRSLAEILFIFNGTTFSDWGTDTEDTPRPAALYGSGPVPLPMDPGPAVSLLMVDSGPTAAVADSRPTLNYSVFLVGCCPVNEKWESEKWATLIPVTNFMPTGTCGSGSYAMHTSTEQWGTPHRSLEPVRNFMPTGSCGSGS
jgi:hypothetical protein